jgi:glutathione S-transferase
MANLKIYGTSRSRANRVIWMAEELGISYETISVDLSAPRDPAFLAVNPNGRLPAIDDDGFHLFESMAINLYLAKKHGGPLTPRDLGEDAKMIQWSRLSHAYDVPAAGEARRKYSRQGARDAEAADRGFGPGAGSERLSCR